MVQTSPRTAIHERSTRRLVGLGLLLLCAALGCKTRERAEKKEERERLSVEMFQEMIRKGTLSPVDSMEDPFGEFHPEMGATPEDFSTVGGGGERVTLDGAMVVFPEPGSIEPESTEPEAELSSGPLPPPNYYGMFGTRIIVHRATGLISKPYPMRSGASTEMMNFIIAYADFPLWNGDGVQPLDTIFVEVLEKYDTEYLSTNMRAPGPAPGKDVEMGDWLMVTAGPDLLEDVENFIDTFAGGPQQIEIEAKIVEFVERETLDLGVSDATVDFPSHTLLDQIGFDFPNLASPETGGEVFAGISAIHDGVTYAAMFEALAAYENVSIVSRPKVAVRDGIKAKIESIRKIPYLSVTGINNSGNATTTLSYQDVGVQLYVTPRLVGTGTIALQIDIQASQQTGEAVTLEVGSGDGTRLVSTPILSTRSAETLVYLKPQQAVILGGLISERMVERENGIPILMDLPLIGYLFKSTLESTEKTTLLFFIRPRLIEGIDLNQPF